MISSAVWVRRGVAKTSPEFYEPTEEEIEVLVKKQEIALEILERKKEDEEFDEGESSEEESEDEEGENKENEDAEMEVEEKKQEQELDEPEKNEEEEALMKELRMDEYDNEEGGVPIFGAGLKGLSYHADNAEDPYITLEEEIDEDDLDDLLIKPTDNLILAAKTEEDVSYLEVHIYEEDTDNLYVHHDVMIPAFPLCVEWIGCGGETSPTGNFAAVGTFQPEIEIWNIDVVDALYPHMVLGESDPQEKKSKKSKKPQKSAERHTDAVLGLSWNKGRSNILGSCSADHTVKLWDLNTKKCLRSFEHHTDKVQSMEWNPTEPAALLTGSYDKTVAAFDSRAPAAVSRWKVHSDVEVVRWNPFEPTYFLVSTEDGNVRYFDARANAGKPLFTLSAHDQAVCALQFNPRIPGCIVTGSYDKIIKVWDIKDNRPQCVISRDIGIGKIFSASFSPDSPFLVAAAGGKGKLTVWDSAENGNLRRHFEGRVIDPPAPRKPEEEMAK